MFRDILLSLYWTLKFIQTGLIIRYLVNYSFNASLISKLTNQIQMESVGVQAIKQIFK